MKIDFFLGMSYADLTVENSIDGVTVVDTYTVVDSVSGCAWCHYCGWYY